MAGAAAVVETVVAAAEGAVVPHARRLVAVEAVAAAPRVRSAAVVVEAAGLPHAPLVVAAVEVLRLDHLAAAVVAGTPRDRLAVEVTAAVRRRCGLSVVVAVIVGRHHARPTSAVVTVVARHPVRLAAVMAAALRP